MQESEDLLARSTGAYQVSAGPDETCRGRGSEIGTGAPDPVTAWLEDFGGSDCAGAPDSLVGILVVAFQGARRDQGATVVDAAGISVPGGRDKIKVCSNHRVNYGVRSYIWPKPALGIVPVPNAI